MKIKNVEQIESIFYVTLKPNLLERLLGYIEKVKKFRDSGYVFTFGGGGIYINEKGEKLENGSYIGTYLDNWQRRF